MSPVRAGIKAGIIASQAEAPWSWTKEYDGGSLPDAGGNYDWAKDGTEDASVAAGILHLDDDSAAAKIAYSQTPGFVNATGWTMECSVQVVSASGAAGDVSNGFLIGDGTYWTKLALLTGAVTLGNNDSGTYAVDLTDGQHVIRMTGKATVYKVYVDGTLRITGTLSAADVTDLLKFGCTSTAQTGECFWEYVNYYTGGAKAP